MLTGGLGSEHSAQDFWDTSHQRSSSVAETQPDCSLLDSLVAAWLYHFSLIFDQEIACQFVFCRKTDIVIFSLVSVLLSIREIDTEMSPISRIQTSLSSFLNLDFKFQAAKLKHDRDMDYVESVLKVLWNGFNSTNYSVTADTLFNLCSSFSSLNRWVVLLLVLSQPDCANYFITDQVLGSKVCLPEVLKTPCGVGFAFEHLVPQTHTTLYFSYSRFLKL